MMIMTIFNDQFCFAQKLPKNAKMWKCKILDTFSMTFWLRTKFLGPAKIQNWTSGSVLEIPNSWLLVVEGAAELCRLILLISDHPIQQGYYKFWNQLFSGTPCRLKIWKSMSHSLTYLLTDSLKARDASASKKVHPFLDHPQLAYPQLNYFYLDWEDIYLWNKSSKYWNKQMWNCKVYKAVETLKMSAEIQ